MKLKRKKKKWGKGRKGRQRRKNDQVIWRGGTPPTETRRPFDDEREEHGMDYKFLPFSFFLVAVRQDFLFNCVMVLPADYHMHTPLCLHATGEPDEYARRAVELGLPEIGMSDHSPMRQDNFDEWRMNFDKLAIYVDKVRRIQKDFPQLHVKMALEVDYFPNGGDWVRELAALYPWDYFIGSVHYVSDDWAIDDPKKVSGWKNRDSYEIWRIYFERQAAAAESGLFEIIGHADLPKKFGHAPPANARPLYEKFLDAAKKSGCAIELNTAGLRKDCAEIYPSREILELAFQKDVPITFGSDAHAPDEVGMNFVEAVALARSAGYTKCCRFEQRRKRIVPF